MELCHVCLCDGGVKDFEMEPERVHDSHLDSDMTYRGIVSAQGPPFEFEKTLAERSKRESRILQVLVRQSQPMPTITHVEQTRSGEYHSCVKFVNRSTNLEMRQ